MRSSLSVAITAGILTACSSSDSGDASANATTGAQADSARLVASPAGFTAPEAVRYDPGQDIYFVSNWGTGDAGAKDDNGFISRMLPDGTLDSLRFIAGGTGGAKLHAPRGMTIVGDTLWVVDADAVRGFNRWSGAPLATIDFSRFRLGFLNDIAASPDALYVTDTGTDRIYRIVRGAITVALHDSVLGRPNGITWDGGRSQLVVVPYGGDSVIRSWTAGNAAMTEIGRSVGAKFDGVEILSGDRVLVEPG